MFGKNKLIGILAGLSLLAACSEDKLEPVGETNVIRFEFPQGSNPWDQEIKQIADDWGMYIIYKDYTKEDLNRNWVYSRWNPQYHGNLPSETEVQIYLDVVKKWILNTYDKNKESDRNQLPVYFYFVNDYRDADSNFIRLNRSGFDYWSLSFTAEELDGGLNSKVLHGVACPFGYNALKARLDKKEIVESAFSAMTDYETAIGWKYESFEDWHKRNPDKDYDYYDKWVSPDRKDPVNVYYKRGFVDEIEEKTFEVNPWAYYPMWMPLIGWEDDKYPPVEERIFNDFTNYIRFSMLYTEKKIYEKYPINSEDESSNQANQLIRDKYHFVVDFVKSTYNIDLLEYVKLLEDGDRL